MKILMLNPPDQYTVIEHPDEENDGSEKFIETVDYGLFPPLGLLYVLTYLEQNTDGHEFYFKDCIAEKISHDDLHNVINEIKPDIIGVTSFTIALMDVVLAARTIRKICPDAHICLGGHHPIAFPLEAAQLPEFDSIVVGEGEIAFTELVKCLEKKKDFSDIKGVYTAETIEKWTSTPMKKDKRFLQKVSAPPAYVDDIDELPAPNREYIKHIDYSSIVGVSSKLATMISSRGCPFKCTFCDIPFKQHRPRDVEKVVDEMEQCLVMGYEEVHFYDDLFNITSQRIIDICDEIDKRKLKIAWDFRGRVNTVTHESLRRARNSGCRMISFGIEAGTDKSLKVLRKGAKVGHAKQTLQWCRELGIETIADYMLGLPGEDRDDVLQSIQALINFDPDYAQIAILTLYPNTQVYDQAVEKGLIEGGRWQEFARKPFIGFTVDHWEEKLTLNELVKLQKHAYSRFYFRPKYIFRSILKTKSLHQLRSKVFGALKVMHA